MVADHLQKLIRTILCMYVFDLALVLEYFSSICCKSNWFLTSAIMTAICSKCKVLLLLSGVKNLVQFC